MLRNLKPLPHWGVSFFFFSTQFTKSRCRVPILKFHFMLGFFTSSTTLLIYNKKQNPSIIYQVPVLRKPIPSPKPNQDLNKTHSSLYRSNLLFLIISFSPPYQNQHITYSFYNIFYLLKSMSRVFRRHPLD